MVLLKIKYLNEDSEELQYANIGDAGLDLRASGVWVVDIDSSKKEIEQEKYEIKPNERILVKTGVKMEIPAGFWGNIRDRSGLALKYGIHTMGGVVDESYRGEIGVIIINLSKNPYMIEKNERIAQMVITPYVQAQISNEKELQESDRGENGFGSTGK